MNMQQALQSFWSGFSLDGVPVPANITGQTEREGVFPCITYAAAAGAMANTIPLTAFVWVAQVDGKSYNEQRSELFRQIAEAIPERGVIISIDDGYIMLNRGTEFETIYNTGQIVNGKKIYGGRISYEIRCYGKMN